MELSSVMLSCGAQVGSSREQQMVRPGVSWEWARDGARARGASSPAHLDGWGLGQAQDGIWRFVFIAES